MTIIECVPFFAFAGIGAYLVLAALFPSLRQTDWSRWKFYTGYTDSKPRVVTRSLGLTKAPRPVAEGKLNETVARWLYVAVGLLFILVALIGIRHLAGVPVGFPDVFERFNQRSNSQSCVDLKSFTKSG